MCHRTRVEMSNFIERGRTTQRSRCQWPTTEAISKSVDTLKTKLRKNKRSRTRFYCFTESTQKENFMIENCSKAANWNRFSIHRMPQPSFSGSRPKVGTINLCDFLGIERLLARVNPLSESCLTGQVGTEAHFFWTINCDLFWRFLVQRVWGMLLVQR